MDNQHEVSADTLDAANSFSITEPMLLSLRRTKPWVRVMSVIGFISVGFMAITGAFNISSMFRAESGLPFMPMIFMGVLNILMALLYLLPSLYLFKFASSLGCLLDGGGADDLEEALSHQKAFWKFVGILTLVLLGIALSGITAAFVIPMISGGFVGFFGNA